jgi:glucokinase
VATIDGRCVLVYDIGGSHISAAVCAESSFVLGPVSKSAQPDEQSTDAFLGVLSHLAAQVAPDLQRVDGAGLAMPGPFDYAEGVSWMRHKMPYLYGVDVRRELAERFGWQDEQVRFLNDAAAYLLGEIGAGAARGVSRVVGITLGTGIGSGFAIDGQLQTGGAGIPPGGEIWNVPFEGGIVEDLISTRFIKQGYLESTGREREVAEIAEGAAQDPAAVEVFQDFGRNLGRVLRSLLRDFAPEVVVLGGGISRSADLFLPAAQGELQGTPMRLSISALGDLAPLVGAGVSWFSRAAKPPVQSKAALGKSALHERA